MSSIVLGCDTNNSNDKNCQDTIAKILEKAGHTVEKLSIGPNYFAKYSYSGKAKGKIGIFLIASGITAIADLYDGNTNFKYAYFGIRGDLKLPRLSTMEEFKKSPIHKDKHGDCISKSCNKLNGKTYPQMNEITKNKCIAVFGTTCKELGDNILKAMGGNTNSSSNSDSGSTIKEALTDVLYGWDGDAECFLRGDTVHIRKIKSPSTATLSLIEGENIHLNSITITDTNPSTVNYLTCEFKDNILTIKDDNLIKRFGEIKSSVQVDNSVKNLDDAKDFLLREWAKIKRDNGHSLECKVQGNTKWKHGLWCRVYLPSFKINDYMYITKVSQDDQAGDWTGNLTLVDYPPGFGEPTSTDNDDSENETTNDEVTT